MPRIATIDTPSSWFNETEPSLHYAAFEPNINSGNVHCWGHMGSGGWWWIPLIAVPSVRTLER